MSPETTDYKMLKTSGYKPQNSPLVIVGLLDEELLQQVCSVYNTIVALHEYPAEKNMVQLLFDDYDVGRQAARKLLEYNHTNILHLAGPDKYASAFYRKKGFTDAFKGESARFEIVESKMNWLEDTLWRRICRKIF